MIFRLLFKATLMIVIFMAIGSYLVYLKTGKFWKPSLSNIDISMPEFLKTKAPVMTPVSGPTETTYKWYKNGQWYYGQVPPKGVDAIRIDKN